MSEVVKALHSARAEFPAIVHNCSNPHFHSTYADLGAILEAVGPALSKYGLTILQTVQEDPDEAGPQLRTELYHIDSSTGLTSYYPLPRLEDPQKLGSCITYARRYALSVLLGIVTEKDDDGNAGAGQQAQRAQGARKAPAKKAAAPAKAAPPKAAAAKPADEWESDEARTEAHNALGARIGKLPEEIKATCRTFRAENGWPLTPAKFAELSEVVRTAEALTAGAK